MSISNGGPPLDDSRAETIFRLKQQITALLERAQARTRSRVHGQHVAHEPWRFFPSRLVRCPRDRQLLEEASNAILPEELALRMPQIERLRRKLQRMGVNDIP